MGEESATRVNALVSLLASHRQPVLDELRRSYPEEAEILQVGTQLGAAKTHGSLKLIVAIEGLKVIRERVGPNLDSLRKRLARAKTLRLIASILATLTSAGTVTAVAADWERAKVITAAVISLCASVLPLVAAHLETSLYGGKESLSDLIEVLIATSVEAEQLERDFAAGLHRRADTETKEELIQKANELAARLRKVELSFGQPI